MNITTLANYWPFSKGNAQRNSLWTVTLAALLVLGVALSAACGP